MKLVKSLLLGSAAGLCAVAGAQAADLPVRKAAPVEYVRVCTAYGAGFFYIPGTDTCLRVGGRARFEYQYTSQGTRASSNSGYRTVGRLNLDARTQTAYGTLRTFVRFEIASRSGGYFKSGTQERYANAFFGTGADTSTQLQKYVELDKAFIQFAGFTAGRAASFYDFYAHDLELVGSSFGSDASATNLLAYTATFGQGFSATLSIEDPTYRRNVAFYNAASGTTGLTNGVPQALSGVNFLTGATPVAFIATGFNAAGVPISAVALDVTQRNNLPDFVGALRYDQPWGSAQVSAAVHELRVGTYSTAFGTGGAFNVNGYTGPVVRGTPAIPDAEYGYAVQGGLKFNLPQIAPGDVLWLQAAYSEGASSYTGAYVPQGQDSLTSSFTNRFVLTQTDVSYDARGNAHLTESYSGTVGFLHYWTPEIRQGVFASHVQVLYDKELRTSAGPTGVTFVRNQFDPTLKSYSGTYVGSNVIWSPVRDLDIGVEVVYERLDVRGRVADANKGGTAAVNGTTVGGTGRTATVDDNYLARLRIQRDF